ncbi:hypothetical protein Y032_0017g3291 [Ancylostoma ceylanicum]|uniref:Uncharacterized protein n=1 Tax=Ancylostoma ceylanicum TaxID=53326 RepID=A0A016V4Z1_9BILA|nr:hypothetical protein Y032_0017g3291 [Ancylostoma ceylanicum]
METSDGAPPGLPPPGLSQSPHNNSTGEFSTDISLSRDPAETHNSLALEPTSKLTSGPSKADEVTQSQIISASPLSAEHMGDDDATDVPVMRTRTSSGTDYDEVDMDTSSPPLSPPSRDPADTLTCLSSGRLDLSEEALLASPKGRKDELELSASLENLAVTMPPTATVLPGSDRFGLRCRQREEAVNREDSPSPTSGSGAPPPKRAAAELDATEFPPLSGFSSPPPGPSQPWPAASAPDEGGPPEYRRDTSPQRGGSGRFQRGGRNSGRGRGRGGGRGRGSNRRDRPAPRNQHWGTRATDAETDDKPARIPSQTPESFYHYLMRSHPWGEYVNPRPVRRLRDDTVEVLTRMPTDVYEHPPSSGYLRLSFNRTLFPKVHLGRTIPMPPMPVIELQHLEDTIAFRDRSNDVLRRTLDGTYVDDDVADVLRVPVGVHDTVLIPPIIDGTRPVLYQVVSTGWGTGVILEAKDFFTMGPDRRDLHCIILDQHAINKANNMRGFDKTMVSVKDFVWVYDVKPTLQALRNPSTALDEARIPRTTALENNSVYFFRVSSFVFSTPDTLESPIYGLVLFKVQRRNRTTHLKIAFEGAPEAVVVTAKLCDFSLEDIQVDDFVCAITRYNASCATRFSEPPASEQARKILCQKMYTNILLRPATYGSASTVPYFQKCT